MLIYRTLSTHKQVTCIQETDTSRVLTDDLVLTHAMYADKKQGLNTGFAQV